MTHVEGRVAIPDGARDAFVLPLQGARKPFPVDPASGRFAGTYGALNVHPATIRLLVYIPGQRPFVLAPGRDFTLGHRDGDATATVDVDPARARPARPLSLTCAADACSGELPPDARGCQTTAILIDGASASFIAPSSRAAAGGGTALTAQLPMPLGRPRSLVLVATCEADDHVSDVAQFDGP